MSIKISQLPVAGSIANTAIFPIVQNSTTESATISQLASFLGVGPQGSQGNQGTSGPQGSQGTGGGSGPQGSQGNQGTGGSGPQGNQGNQGNQGTGGSGPQGSQGNQGNQGTSGPQGNQGSAGSAAVTVDPFVSTNAGPFVFSHGIGHIPLAVTFTMTNANSLGQFWLNTSNVALGYDSANVYGIASDIAVSGQIIIFG
jgi:hypothetical protein